MKILRLMISRKWIITTIVVIIGSLICVRLGIWQLDRLAQRRAFNAHYRETSTLPALKLTFPPADDLTDMEYRPVLVSGTYDFEHQVVLRNQVYENLSGYHLLTPLLLSDRTAILVDRGWIPQDGNAESTAWRVYDQPIPSPSTASFALGRPSQRLAASQIRRLPQGRRISMFGAWSICNGLLNNFPTNCSPFLSSQMPTHL